MKIKWQGFLGTNHSWSIVGQNISRVLTRRQHRVDLVSTNGLLHFPQDLAQHVRAAPDENYDVQLTYTALKNFPTYLANGDKNRIAIWNYETTVLPAGFAKYHTACDVMLPSSEFSKKIFLDGGIPEEKLKVIPHGVDLSDATAAPHPLKTKRRVKICANIAQPHVRKNMTGLLQAYGKAFSKKDDVCLVLKVSDKKPQLLFEESFQHVYQKFKLEFPNHADIEIIKDFLPNIYALYNACDVLWTMSHTECFWMPGLEGMASKNVIVAPRYGGQLDFLNNENSVLIDGSIMPADKRMQYWSPSPYAKAFKPSISDAVDKIRHTVANIDVLKDKFVSRNLDAVQNYTWDKVVDSIEKLFV